MIQQTAGFGDESIQMNKWLIIFPLISALGESFLDQNEWEPAASSPTDSISALSETKPILTFIVL